MKVKRAFLLTVFIFQYVIGFAAQRAVLVHNTYQEIEACKGKLQLKLIRIWGGDEEQDEQKFFKFPEDIAVDTKESIYICDQYNYCVKVFDYTGKYLRTIGRKGRGPGDLFGPSSIDFSPSGDLWVAEMGGRRIQCFSASGKSKTIFKHKGFIWWMRATSKNEIAVYCHQKTFDSRKLITIYNSKGELQREIGVYHDKSRSPRAAEKLKFSIDNNDRFYAANSWTPVLRKYSPDGNLLMVITFETPFDIPVKIVLNDKGDEIQRLNDYEPRQARIKRKGDGVIITLKEDKGKKKKRYTACGPIDTDSRNNIYLVTPRRLLTDKESNATRVSGSFSTLDRSLVDFDVVENIDHNQLLVFNPEGKVTAEGQLTTFCDGIYVVNNRIFILDGLLNQRILEYEMIFKK